jgi:hypothetical protein
MRLKLLLAITLFAGSTAFAQQAPVLFFTDLTDGPNTGNSDTTHGSTGGAYVTLYGNFLDNFSSVQLNGSSCLTVVSNPSQWLWYERMVVKLGTSCATGNFTVTTSAGTSNGVPFTVRTGGIYYVSTSGSDSNSGSFGSPWKTIANAVQSAQPPDGRIIYVENGVNQTSVDSGGWGALTLRYEWSQPSAAGYASALITYPGATSTLGSTSLSSAAIVGTDCTATNGAAKGWWTIAGFTLRGQANVISLQGPSSNGCQTRTGNGSQHWRLVGLDLSAPQGNGQTAVIHTANLGPDNSGNIDNWLLGNNVHDSGTPISGGPDDQFHGIYNGDNSAGFEDGWNQVANIVGCRGIQIYSNYANEYNYRLHDNTIHDTTCDGIVAATSDPSQGQVLIYNNLLFHTGIGPQNTSEGGGTFTCIFVARTRQTGSAGSGTTYVYNNTCYDPSELTNMEYSSCSTAEGGITLDDDDGVGGANTSESAVVSNNLIYTKSTTKPCGSGIPYWLSGVGASFLTGSNNLTYGEGCSNYPCSSAQVTGSVTSNPNVVSISETGCPTNCSTNLHLTSGSTAVGAASNSSLSGSVPSATLLYDHDGLLRPSPPSIGAYEYTAGSGSTSSPPAPPTGLAAVVN